MNDMKTAPRDGSPVTIHFPAGGKIVASCSRWLRGEERWNGMCRGQEPIGWLPAGEKRKTEIDPFS